MQFPFEPSTGQEGCTIQGPFSMPALSLTVLWLAAVSRNGVNFKLGYADAMPYHGPIPSRICIKCMGSCVII